MSYKKILCIDFDGVIHSYTSSWSNAKTISDPPVEGAIQWLTDLVECGTFDVNIYSSRSKEPIAIAAMVQWLSDNGMKDPILAAINFPTQKPAAFLTIDDRAICFDGTFPTIDAIDEFKPWNKKGV